MRKELKQQQSRKNAIKKARPNWSGFPTPAGLAFHSFASVLTHSKPRPLAAGASMRLFAGARSFPFKPN